MLWQSEWAAISARVQGLAESSRFFVHGHDENMIASRALQPYTDDVFTDLKKFYDDFQAILPHTAASCLKSFIRDWKRYHSKPMSNDQDVVLKFVNGRLALLIALCAEFTYKISDTTAIVRRISERAFIHLQACIRVDSNVQRLWIDAFESSGETACERLGAVHLLHHGIWAFKAHARGEATDLVFGEPLKDGSHITKIAQVAEALVLTEWKCVSNQAELETKRKEAHYQAKRYGWGSLAGIELAAYRYLVMVSEDSLEMPAPWLDPGDSITYHPINIAVKLKSPSVNARKRRSSDRVSGSGAD